MRRLLAAALAALVLVGAPLASAPIRAAEQRTFIVDLADSVDAGRDSSAIARSYGGEATDVYDHVVGGFAFTGTDVAAARLARDRRVVRVEQDAIYHAVNLPPDNLNHLNRLDVPEAHDAGYAGFGVTIAIIDTGIYRQHPVFNAHDNILKGKTCVGGTTTDLEGHGTATAGNAVGKIGVAHEANAVPVKVFPGSSLSTTASKIVCGLNWVAKKNNDVPGTIDVVNLSIAGPGSSAMASAVQNVRDTGAIVVAATGNTGGPQPLYPARYPGVIAASAIASGDSLATFSNDGGDLAAPGVNIKSAENGGGYSQRSGTSRAAPMVAGAAAIVLGEDPLADVLTILRRSGSCPNGNVNTGGGDCDGDGNWANDSDDTEPLVNAYCAGALADLGNVSAECGEI